MLDIRFIRDHAERVQKAAGQKGYTVDIKQLLEVDEDRRKLLAAIEALRQERNTLAGGLTQTKPSPQQIEKGRQLKAALAEQEDRLKKIEVTFWSLLKKVPNMPADDVPVGATEDDNVVTKTVGEPPRFDFEPKNHWQLGEAHGWIDKERAAKVAGSRFAYIKGALARLHFALLQFAIDRLTDQSILQKIITENKLSVSTKPFTLVLPPAMIRTEVYEGTARLDGEEVTYKLADDELWLNASAEHSLAPMYKDEILNEAELPVRYLGYTTAFRREAGTYGKDMEGIFRLHQFDKLEMEGFATPETSMQEHLFFVAIQEYLMQQLGLPYRVLLKCSADIGGPNARGIDIDTWLPGQGKYRETHTADYITDYQTRRLNTRIRRSNGELVLAHTNDATVFSQRPLIAIVENYQQADGTVKVPRVLQSYLGGKQLL